MNILFENNTDFNFDLSKRQLLNTVIEETLKYENFTQDVEISLIIVTNDEIQKINSKFRNIDRPTDVLSFPMIDFQVPEEFSLVEAHPEDYFNSDTGELMLGDIVISMDKVYEQAREFGHSPERELAFLVAHSMLHLSGYDHEEEAERLLMEDKQEEILQQKGYTRD